MEKAKKYLPHMATCLSFLMLGTACQGEGALSGSGAAAENNVVSEVSEGGTEMNPDEAAYQAYFEDAIKNIKESYTATGVPITHESPVLQEEMVAMGDGVRLKTFYWLPDTTGTFPVIVQRGCYEEMDLMSKAMGEELAKRGYAYVFQYCRGIGDSEGKWVPMENERSDGLDAMNWIISQDWAGNIGYSGSSYLAMTGWAIADAVPLQVKSMYLTNYGANRFISAYQQGLLKHDSVTSWAMVNAGFPIDADYIESCKFRPHSEVDESLWGGRLDWYRDSVTATSDNDSYWSEGMNGILRSIPSKINIPIYMGEGWYDHHLGSALLSYKTLSESAKTHSQLVIGGWNHFMEPCLQDRDVTNLQSDDTRRMLDWFEQTLKREELPEAKISTYQINGDTWREWDVWPLPAKGERKFYLSGDKQSDGYGLSDSISSGKATFVYDPENPVPSHGGESLLHTKEAIGSLLQPDAGWRKDVLSFVSEPLTEDLEILGQINVALYVASDAEDTAFTAKIMEVRSDGKAYNIRSTIATIAEQLDSPYIPGDVVKLELPMWEIDWLVQAGSKIRIDISSSDFPQYAIHSNYPGVWSEQEQTKPATQSIYMDGEHPSFISLPSY